MTITEPGAAVSTKWAESFGAVLSDARTIWTVYAGAHILTGDAPDVGESMWMSGM